MKNTHGAHAAPEPDGRVVRAGTHRCAVPAGDPGDIWECGECHSWWKCGTSFAFGKWYRVNTLQRWYLTRVRKSVK